MVASAAAHPWFAEVQSVTVDGQHHVARVIGEEGFLLGGSIIQKLFHLVQCFLVGLACSDAIALSGTSIVQSTARA